MTAPTTPDTASPAFLDPVETMSRAALEELQVSRLLQMLPHAWRHSPLIRAVWDEAGVCPDDIRSIDHFRARVPFIDKDMVRAFRDRTGDPFGGTLCTDMHDITFVGSSSGTTGDPTLFAYRWERARGYGRDVRDFWEPGHDGYFGMIGRDTWEMGLRPGDYAMLFVPATRGFPFRTYQEIGAVPVFFDHHPDELPRFVELTRRLRPTFLYLLSTPLLYGLERLERETGIDLHDVFSSFRAVVFGGEPLSARNQALVERWGIPLRQLASLGDTGSAYECCARDGMHAWEDIALVECLDPDSGEPVADGERGEMVVTSLVNRLDPLIRFRSEDIVRFTRQPCTCGRTHGRFWPLGRAGDEVIVQGTGVLPCDVWPVIEEIDECYAALFQVIRTQREMDTLRLRVGYDGEPDLEELAQRIAAAVEAALGLRPDVELQPSAELLKLGPPHKIPRTAKR